MRKRLTTGLLTVLLAAALPAVGPAAETSDADAVNRARAAAKDLGERLKGELVAAIKSGGPVMAIQVCNTVAGELANEISKQHELTVGRTSLRVRNAKNAPDAYERKVLEEFLEKASSGADLSKLEHFDLVSENGDKTFRYMKAIPMAAEPCLACHGTELKPEVKAEISRLYPEDQATGFKPGELRGAFTISGKLD